MNDLHPLYVLRVFGEERAAKQLAEIGVTSWAPTFKRLKLAVGRQPARLVEAPLIPGYLFARLGKNDFAAALATERVYGVIRSNGAPKPLPEAEFTKVMMMVISGKFDDRLPSTKARPRGERRRGLAGLQAWFEAAETMQLQTKSNTISMLVGGEPVSDGDVPSRRSTLAGRKAKWPADRMVRSVA
jgi:transcription antitermination factor NusG